jgi:hypothetical protein
MNRCIFAILTMVLFLFCYPDRSHAADRMVVGGYYNNGFALVAGDGYEEWRFVDRDDRTPKSSVGGGAYFDYFFTDLIGIEAGMGFLNKGIRFSDGDARLKESIVYMELPILAKFTIKGFQISAGLALFVALSGRTIAKIDDRKDIQRWNGNDWDYIHRVNLGPKIVLGYAIPVGPVSIVPGMSWTIHFINDLNDDKIKEDYPFRNNTDFKMRATNLMFFVAVEWTLP